MCIIIYFAYRFSRMLGSRTAGRFKNKYLKELDRMVMGQEEYISLVRVGSEFHLIGVTRQNINHMSKIDEESLVEIDVDKPTGQTAYSEFFSRLRNKINGGGETGGGSDGQKDY